MIDFKGKRIFYFEDDVRNRSIVQLILERHNAEFQFERWGHDPAQHLRNFMPIDVILMDLMFPNNVSGYDLFTIIRKYDEFNHIPIIAISAADPAIEMNKARKMGFAGFISKPVHLVEFPRQIDAAMHGEKVWQS